ncbi:IS200/IS605 family transposase [Pontiella sp.]|uniref:IS200/IS605 family transposase n=1 Tax=Pontiella sp. TaxID=2837462 RepID=UPI003563FD45
MPQSFCQLHAHIVFSTKNREPYLGESIRPKVHAYMTGILSELGCSGILIGGFVDHVHCLCQLSKKEAPVKIVQMLKQDSSKYIKTLDDRLHTFGWQNGYGLFSVSPTHLDSVRKYISEQVEHHRVKSFQEEYREFLERYNVSFDERYAWD